MALSSSLKSININNYIPSLFPFPSSYLKAKTSLQPLSPGSICGATNIRPSSLIENPKTSSPMLKSKKRENNYQPWFDCVFWKLKKLVKCRWKFSTKLIFDRTTTYIIYNVTVTLLAWVLWVFEHPQIWEKRVFLK